MYISDFVLVQARDLQLSILYVSPRGKNHSVSNPEIAKNRGLFRSSVIFETPYIKSYIIRLSVVFVVIVLPAIHHTLYLYSTRAIIIIIIIITIVHSRTYFTGLVTLFWFEPCVYYIIYGGRHATAFVQVITAYYTHAHILLLLLLLLFVYRSIPPKYGRGIYTQVLSAYTPLFRPITVNIIIIRVSYTIRIIYDALLSSPTGRVFVTYIIYHLWISWYYNNIVPTREFLIIYYSAAVVNVERGGSRGTEFPF